MAKQKLFGNRNEPACETCALGKRGSDGQSVLCRRVGAVPLHHHCRHYQYDPLRRIPKRDPVLPSYDATDFWLDNLEDVIEPVAKSPVDNETVLRLREYLIHSNEPDVETILALLDCPATETEETTDKTVEEPDEITAEETADETTEEPDEIPPEETADETVEEPDENIVEETAETASTSEIRFPKNPVVTPEEVAASLLEPIADFEELDESDPEETIASSTVQPSDKAVLTPEEEALAAFKEEIAVLENTLHARVPVATATPDPGVTYIPVPLAEATPAPTEQAPYEPTEEDRQVFAEIDRALSSETASIADSSPDIEGDLERLDVQKADAFHAVFHDPALDLSMLSPEELQSEDTASHDPQFDDLARRLDATSTLSLSDDGFHDEFEPNEKDIVLLSPAQLKDEAMEELALGADGKIRVVQPPPEKKKRK